MNLNDRPASSISNQAQHLTVHLSESIMNLNDSLASSGSK